MDTETFIFKGCKFLQYDKPMCVPRQGISLGGNKSLCYARFDIDGKLNLVQFCKRGRMNHVESGITYKCCGDFEEITHTVDVPIWELDSSPRNFESLKRDLEE
jgi:hypothetical protein